MGAISAELKGAAKLDGSFSVWVNRAVIDYAVQEEDEVQVLFVSEDQAGSMFTFKHAGEPLPIVNSGRYGVRVAGLQGRQKAYVCINGTWYDTGKAFVFGLGA